MHPSLPRQALRSLKTGAGLARLCSHGASELVGAGAWGLVLLALLVIVTLMGVIISREQMNGAALSVSISPHTGKQPCSEQGFIKC